MISLKGKSVEEMSLCSKAEVVEGFPVVFQSSSCSGELRELRYWLIIEGGSNIKFGKFCSYKNVKL